MVRVGNAGKREPDKSSDEHVSKVISQGRDVLKDNHGVSKGAPISSRKSQGAKKQTSNSAGYNPFANPNLSDPSKPSEPRGSIPTGKSTPAKDKKTVNKSSSAKSKKTSKAKKRFKLSKRFKIIFGVVSTIVALILGYFFVLYPPVKSVDSSTSGRSAYSSFISCLNSYDASCLQGDLKSQIDLVGDNTTRSDLLLAVGASVSVEYPTVQYSNIWGRPASDPFTRLPVEGETYLNNGESVTLTVVDWANIPLNDSDIKTLIDQASLQATDSAYRTKLTDVFAQYITGYLSQGDGSYTTEVDWTPSITCSEDQICEVSEEEYNNISNLLFNSDDFSQLQDMFAEHALKFTDPDSLVKTVSEDVDVVRSQNAQTVSDYNDSSVEVSEAPTDEATSDEVSEAPTDEASESSTDTPSDEASEAPTDEASATPSESPTSEGSGLFDNEGTDDEVVFERSFPSAYYLEDGWIGVYSSSDSGESGLLEHIGDGSQSSPAGLNTTVTTVVTSTDSTGVVNYTPISVSLTTLDRDQDAFDKFEALDTRNRGFTTKSSIEYAYLEFTVTNLSDAEVTVTDNSFIGDSSANVITSTGTIYGMTSSITLAPQESGVITSWLAAENVDDLYLLWGKNFNRDDEKAQYVWFRVFKAIDGVVTMDSATDSESASPEVSESASPVE